MPMTRRNWKSGAKRTTTNKTYGRTTMTHSAGSYYSPTKYNTYKKDLQAKIGSYRTINQQFSGATKVTAFSPTGAGKWIKYVNQGANIYKFSSKDFQKFWGKNWNNPTPTAAYNFMKKKFGVNIKAVTQGKGSYWLVAANPKISARQFTTYNWK